jgi:hypothetical protein
MTQTQSPGTHVDPIELMMEMLSKIQDSGGKYDSDDQSLFYLIASLIAKMEGLSAEVAGIGDESNTFSGVLSDVQNVDRDVTRIQKWYADHKDMPKEQAIHDPEFQKDVQQFSDDLRKLYADSKAAAHNAKYKDDGMSEATDCVDMIWKDDTITGKSGQDSIGKMIMDGNEYGLISALYDGAKATDDKSGPFHKWQEDGKDGKPGLKQVEQDFGMFVSNFNQTLNVDGTYLQQIQQTGQNDISSLNSMMNMIIQNLRAG